MDSINTSRGGVPKRPVFDAFIDEAGLSGDAQANRDLHGGPDRAVVLYSLDLIRQLQAEGHPIAPGATGENLTIEGLDWSAVVPGVRLDVGGVRLEITRYAPPCRSIRGAFLGGRYQRISQTEHPGWSHVCARVLEPGLVSPGDPVRLTPSQVDRPSSA